MACAIPLKSASLDEGVLLAIGLYETFLFIRAEFVSERQCANLDSLYIVALVGVIGS